MLLVHSTPELIFVTDKGSDNTSITSSIDARCLLLDDDQMLSLCLENSRNVYNTIFSYQTKMTVL